MLNLSKNLKFFLTKIFPLIISLIVLIYYCISENNLLSLIKILPKLNFFYLFCSFLLVFIYLLFDSLVLSKTVRIYSNFFSYFKLTMISHFYSSITPFNSGGQPAQVLELSKTGISVGKIITLLLKKVFIYQLCTVIISFISILFYTNSFENRLPRFKFLILIGFLLQFVPILLIILLNISKSKILKIIEFLLKLLNKIKLIKNPKKHIEKITNQLNFLVNNDFSIDCKIDVYLFSFLQNISLNIVPFFVAKAFGLKGFPIFEMLAGQVFITLVSSFSPLPGSSGLAVGAFVIILNNFFDNKFISIAMILNRFITYYFIIILSFIQFKKIRNFNSIF